MCNDILEGDEYVTLPPNAKPGIFSQSGFRYCRLWTREQFATYYKYRYLYISIQTSFIEDTFIDICNKRKKEKP